MKQNTSLQHGCRYMLCTALFTLAINAPSLAQPIISATNTASNSVDALTVCDAATCGTGTPRLEVYNLPLSLNADMATIAYNSTNGDFNDPSFFGINGNGNFKELFGIAYSGVVNGSISRSGFTVNTKQYQMALNPSGDARELPYYWTSSVTANDPDIAIGTVYNGPGWGYSHFAMVVFEVNGEIVLERYPLDVDISGIVTIYPPPYLTTICPTSLPPGIFCATALYSGFQHQVIGHLTEIDPGTSHNSTGNNSKPKIELWHAPITVANGNTVTAAYFAVTWQKLNSSTGQYEIWGIDGTADGTTINAPFLIALDGKEPDVVAVTASLPHSGPSAGIFRAYTSYMDNNNEILKVGEWRYNTQAVTITRTLETVTIPDALTEPRISGPAYYDYDNPSELDPLAVVVANDNRGGVDNVSAYKMYHGSIINPPFVAGPNISMPNITNYTAPGFSDSSKIAVMPVVTGVGRLVSGLAVEPAYSDYMVEFYSDLNTGGTSGDYYAFGISGDVGNTAIQQTNTHYYQVYNVPPDHSTSTYFDRNSNKAVLAVATSNNTGHDLLSTFYSGDNSGSQQINVVFHGQGNGAYSFKPGRPSGVANTGNKAFATYPNPVKDVLNITEADGAAFIVTNMMGQALQTGRLEGNKAQVGTTSLTPGVYFLTITKDGHTEKVKFVKN